MLSLLSGNSRVLLTIDGRGSWAQLYYPYPGLHQHLLNSRLGLFDQDTGRFAWTGQDAAEPTQAGYLGDSNVGRTRLRSLDMDRPGREAKAPGRAARRREVRTRR